MAPDRGNPLLRQVSLAAAAAFHDTSRAQSRPAELLEPMPCDTDHLYAHCGDDAPDDSEQDRLRAIVVLHTDLIQHQEEVIAERGEADRRAAHSARRGESFSCVVAHGPTT
ncbi:hypothetical protein HPB52_006104 [Rhipicephalus sanguineus]|uniref:Uncharacterized protein n=1 Tax=Rhipicephalus sanguineus TaxID=34632 RepID=A0A9D4SY30_RHISA|nr:hypothetical protein HPB52_006104 [Rhipicephalus sanguineus]